MKDYSDTTKNYTLLADTIEEGNISALTVLDIFVNYLGLQILDKDFMENLEAEEIL